MRVQDIVSEITAGLRAAEIPSPRLEAELLCALALKTTRLAIAVHGGRELSGEEEKECRRLAGKRGQGVPMAYLAGSREFYGRDFLTEPGTLIPRPETEILVEELLGKIPAQSSGWFADIGTGTGCIGITLALERPGMRGILLEKSPAAAVVAEKNRKRLGAANVRVILGDLFSAPLRRESFDAVVSNPPYIGEGEKDDVMPAVLRYEPGEALFSEEEGLQHLRGVLNLAAGCLKRSGIVAVEHGWHQGEAVRGMMRRKNFLRIMTKKDLAGLDRTTLASI